MGDIVRPASLEDLFATAGEDSSRILTGTRLDKGHIHLHVADVSEAERFYDDFIGFAVTQRSYPGALFFAAGGYHYQVKADLPQTALDLLPIARRFPRRS